MTGGLGNKLTAIPVLPGKATGRVERAAGARRVFAMPIDLPDFFCDREDFLAVGNGFEAARGPAIHGLVIAIGDGHVHAGIAVGSGTKNKVIFAYPQAPGVVVAGADKFQRRAVRFKAEDSLAEPKVFATHGPLEARITDRAPNP